MQNLELLSSEQWSLATLLGTTHPFFVINTQTIIDTWIILGILIFFCIIARVVLFKSNGLARYAIIRGVQFFMDLCEQNLGIASLKHVSFIVALFMFLLACNTCAIIPWIEEPTGDINTCLAAGLLSFGYIQTEIIKQNGLWAYISSFFQPFFLLLPLNIIGKLSSILSISFRLFGNIFGGSLITKIYFGAISKWWLIELLCLFAGINIIITGFFTIFEGALQAFVFTMITVTYLGLALQGEGH